MFENNKTIKVQIVADVRAKCNYIVDMNEEDYKKFERIIDSQMTSSKMNDAILDIASKYGIYDNIDFCEPEDIEFHLIGE
ncbi:hypothetical protein [Candidatus Arsenophonus triatominarum]|uniref:hypothetical protein n=1 Tax=Candidatus Arsenophonus triatominarum TaxID=57911 RepID=UPI0007C55FF8|nr:hypothetical protein [Candidatus Arsenophonus triatominarum]